MPGRRKVRKAKDQKGNYDSDADQNMNQDHRQREEVLEGLRLLDDLQDADGQQINAAGAQDGDGGKDQSEQDAQARADGRLIRPAQAVYVADRRRRRSYGRYGNFHEYTKE